MRFFLFLILVGLTLNLNAQTNWYKKSMKGQKTESFVINAEGDTIQGMLEFDIPYKMAKRIEFYPEGTEDAVKYDAEDIKGFAIYGKVWVSRRIKTPYLDVFGGTSRTTDVFLLPVIEEGPIRVFIHYINELFMDVNEEWIQGYSYVLFKGDEKNNVYLRGDEDWMFDNQVWLLLSDSKEIVSGIQSEEYAWDDLITLINRYNYFKSKEE